MYRSLKFVSVANMLRSKQIFLGFGFPTWKVTNHRKAAAETTESDWDEYYETRVHQVNAVIVFVRVATANALVSCPQFDSDGPSPIPSLFAGNYHLTSFEKSWYRIDSSLEVIICFSHSMNRTRVYFSIETS